MSEPQQLFGRKRATRLSEAGLAFLDDIEGLGEDAYDMPFLCELVHDLVQAVRRNLRVDWTKPHRENVKMSVLRSVKMVLRERGVKREHFQFILKRVMEQAEAMYRDWPRSAELSQCEVSGGLSGPGTKREDVIYSGKRRDG